LRPTDARAIARNEDTGDIALTPVINGGYETGLPLIPTMCDTEGPRGLRVRHHAMVQEDRLALDALLSPAFGKGHGLCPAFALDRDPRGTGVAWNPRADDLGQQSRTLQQVAPAAQGPAEMPHRSDQISPRLRLDHCHGRRSGTDHLRRDQIQQRAGADQNGIPCHHARLLEKDLPRPRGHDAGQGPARQRHGPFQRTGCDKDAGRPDLCATPVPAVGDPESILDGPDNRTGNVIDRRVAQPGRQRCAVGIVLAQNIPAHGGGPVHIPVDLPAGAGLFVQNGDAQAQPGRLGRSRHPGRACADHDKITPGHHPPPCRAAS
jgi:hypothetical protein